MALFYTLGLVVPCVFLAFPGAILAALPTVELQRQRRLAPEAGLHSIVDKLNQPTSLVNEMKIGDCLEAYREKNNLTWRSLAKEIGVDHAVLFKLRTRPTTSTDSAMRLMNWLLTQSKGNK